MVEGLSDFKSVFFIGIAGSGMSAIAQYLAGNGKQVSGSDRYFLPGESNHTREKLEALGIACFLQNGQGIHAEIDLVVVSTAVEDTVEEVQLAKQLNIPIMKRSALLALIAASKKTIAVGGTSGKSTTCAMLFDILEYAGKNPSIISGAGLVSLIKKGFIGNAKAGSGEWLVIEADESDGSIVQYKPEVGVLLNIEKDHKEMEALMEIFAEFRQNTHRLFVVNQAQAGARKLSKKVEQDFSSSSSFPAGYQATGYQQKALAITFEINGIPFSLQTVGKHNMENALAASATAAQLGVDLATCSQALKTYEGIYRRHQIMGRKNGVWLIDDYAHNPVKCAISIEACQEIAPRVVAWFQPHGYGPTRFLRHDFVEEIGRVLRPGDEIWMSEIFYAGGTTVKDISALDLINDLKALDKPAFFVANRDDLLEAVRPHLTKDCVLLLMGARDPSLENFANEIWEQL
jgi:UDP-N-acetylmuramate--alanine ligase